MTPHNARPAMLRILVVGGLDATEALHSEIAVHTPEIGNHLEFVLLPTAQTATDILCKHPQAFDAVLINCTLPDRNSITLCAELRCHGVKGPLLILGSGNSESCIVRSLDAGACDFIRAPLRLSELRARIRAQIRAYEASEGTLLTIGPFDFRPASRVVIRRLTGKRINLTDKESALLIFLYQAEKPVSRWQLLHEVWGYNARVTTHTVETHIYRLRRKLTPLPDQSAWLVHDSAGYRLLRDWPPGRPPARVLPAPANSEHGPNTYGCTGD